MTAITQTIMGDQNCLLVILVCTARFGCQCRHESFVCFDYLLIKQQHLQSPRVFSLGFLWVTKIFLLFSLSLSLFLKAHQSHCFHWQRHQFELLPNSKKLLHPFNNLLLLQPNILNKSTTSLQRQPSLHFILI